MFLERKIIGRIHGEKSLQFHAANGYLSLVDSVHQIGENHNFTALVPDLSGGVDPDDSFSKVPYEKGFYFLYYLQVDFSCLPLRALLVLRSIWDRMHMRLGWQVMCC